MGNHAFEIIKKYVGELAELMEKAVSENAVWKIIVKVDDYCYETTDCADLTHLEAKDVVLSSSSEDDFQLEREILLENKELGAVVISQTNYCMKAAAKGSVLRAALDDMAQIVGYEVKTVSYEKDAVKAALQNAAGCFVKDKYSITTGRSVFEAVVALQVLEKSAEVNLKANVLGGPRFIEEAEAKFMRKNYKENYSKEETIFKSKEGRA